MKQLYLKLILFSVFFFCFYSSVFASTSDEKLVHIINNGEVTKQYIKRFEATGGFVSIEAMMEGNGIVTIHYSVFYAEEEKSPLSTSFSFLYEEENNQYVLSYLVASGEENQDILSYLQVMPYYGVEMNDQFFALQDLLQDRDILSFFSETFDKCYMEKMGVCFTDVTQYKAMLYLVKIEVSDKAAQYAIRHVKELNREEKEKEHTANLLVVAFVLLILIGVVLLLRKCLKID